MRAGQLLLRFHEHVVELLKFGFHRAQHLPHFSAALLNRHAAEAHL